jgi:5'-nucleotidase
VTNDDGIESAGLHELARTLVPLGEVVVVAPDREFSGSSASLGALIDMEPVVRRHHCDDGYEAWSLTGPPALCVVFARLGVFGGRFDLAVSGVNPGANVGRAIYHSGTVGAATTARLGRISSIAVSQDVDSGSVEGQAFPGTIENQHWTTAAEIAAAAAAALLADPPAEAVLLNINVPNLPREQLRGWRRTTIAALPTRALQSATLEPIAGAPDTYRSVVVWGDVLDLPAETDGGAVERGEVSVTWLTPFLPDSPAAAGATEARIADYLGGGHSLATSVSTS